MERYGAFVRGYARSLHVRPCEIEPLLGRVGAGFLSVRPRFERERIREGYAAVEYLAWCIRATLAEMQANGSARPAAVHAGDQEDRRHAKVWSRIALHRATREIRSRFGPLWVRAWDLTTRQGMSDETAGGALGLSPAGVAAARRRVRQALIVEYRRQWNNAEGPPLAGRVGAEGRGGTTSTRRRAARGPP